ncbi:MAG: hypothetical protein Q7J31_16570 [Syntrophales bacterium]|uniref:hypothetical protein n=1 Tax=Candidatus Wunengus sp. YC61 TaxID=3367698 RepID=UPI00271FAC3D|nr:hypothetical protein [Syntrophales bacterium]
MDPKTKQSWENYLNPEATRGSLLAASIYIAGFEALKDSIIERIRYFFWTGFDETGEKFDPKYQTDVLARKKSPVYASLDWLKAMKAVDDADIAAFDRVKACRNKLAHDLLSTLASSGLPDNYTERFNDMIALLHKIELWWIKEVEIPTNPDLDGKGIDYKGIIPGPIMNMRLLCDLALGNDEQSQFYLKEFRKRTGGG